MITLRQHALPATFILSIGMLFAGFFPQLLSLTSAWQAEEYSHGYLIPVLAVMIGWHRLVEKKPDMDKASWLGLPVVLAGMSLHIMAQLSAFEPLSHYGLLLCLTGLIIGFFGCSVTKTLAPALVYLIFCIPIPRLIQVALSAELQLLSSTLGVSILNILGISVFQDGNIIDLGYHKLQVVEACNGLRYLFPLMSFGFLVAFLMQDSLWKRAVIFLSTIPIAIAMNALRIAWVGISVNWGGADMAEGLVHDFQGVSIFVICVLVLLAETWILLKIGKGRGRFRYEYMGPASGPIEGRMGPIGPGMGLFILCCAFLVLHLSGTIQNRPQNTPAHTPFFTFPMNVADWHGKAGALDTNILSVLKPTDYLSADYKKDGQAAAVNLYMAYYAQQKIGVSIHSPANCIPGSGWTIDDYQITSMPTGTQSFPITRMVIKKDGTALLVYYWFFQRGRIINDQYEAKYYLLLDSLLKNRSDGALIRLTTPIKNAEQTTDAEQRIQAFIADSFPLIQGYIPR